MAKTKGKRTLPGQGAGKAMTPVDLFLLAGLPNPLHLRVEQYLKDYVGEAAQVVAVPSSSDGSLYRERTVETLLRASGQFTLKRIRSRAADGPPRPRRLALLYVPAPEDRRLLQAFDHFVFPVPLWDLSEFDDSGRQKRHDRIACEAAIRDAIELYMLELVTWIQPRIEGRRATEPLLLPPRNFHLRDRGIESFFLELSRRSRSWEEAAPEDLVPETFEYEQLPGYLRRDERLAMFRDARDVIFPCARPTQLHWHVPELAPDEKVGLFQDFLRSTYRFGAPLPDGFHHDVQLEWGAEFNRMPFECSREGNIEVSGNHANIYPNDYVRHDA